MAKAQSKGYKNILLGQIEVLANDDLEDTAADDYETMLKTSKLNAEAYSDLILVCSTPKEFGAIERAVTDELPEGDASLALKRLVQR